VDDPHTAAKSGRHGIADPSRAAGNINQTEGSYVAEKSIYEVFWDLDHIPGAIAKKCIIHINAELYINTTMPQDK
jgi:hypothetical protein